MSNGLAISAVTAAIRNLLMAGVLADRAVRRHAAPAARARPPLHADRVRQERRRAALAPAARPGDACAARPSGPRPRRGAERPPRQQRRRADRTGADHAGAAEPGRDVEALELLPEGVPNVDRLPGIGRADRERARVADAAPSADAWGDRRRPRGRARADAAVPDACTRAADRVAGGRAAPRARDAGRSPPR